MPAHISTTQLRSSIKDPISDIYAAWGLLSEAADAHLCGNTDRAALLFGEANSTLVWKWLNPAWDHHWLHVRHNKSVGDTRIVPKTERDRNREPTDDVKHAAIARDGHRCRYCGIPVVDVDIRKWAHQNYTAAVPWIAGDNSKQHAAFQCMWLQYDHVVPHSHGGASTLDNIVVTCALCNYGKHNNTLAQLGLIDPRTRAPVPCSWDGLERLQVRRAKMRKAAAIQGRPTELTHA